MLNIKICSMESVSGRTTEVFRRKRKMLLLLPVILIPMMTLGFYALGGGKGDGKTVGIKLTKGLNMSLPDARFDPKKKALNKLGFYKQSEEDSIRLRERRKMDPYFGWRDSGMSAGNAGNGTVNGEGLTERPGAGGLKLETAPADLQAAEMMRKLELLKGVLSRRQQEVVADGPVAGKVPERISYPGAGLPQGPSMPYAPGGVRSAQGDPDLDKLNLLMDKVLKVRYPGDAPQRDSQTRDPSPALPEKAVLALSAPVREEVMTTLPVEDKDDLETGFIDLDAGGRGDSLAVNMIAAVVDGPQTLISGEAVAFRTAADAMLGGIRIPRGTPLSGRAVLSGDRLQVTVNALRIGDRVVPVSLEVVDMDGMTGIRVKGSINRDASKESADQVVGSLGITPVDASVAGQATAAGLQAAKNLLSRKIRLVRVGLPAGYKVLLKNTKGNH